MNPSPLRTLTLIAALSASSAFAQKRPESAVLIDVRNVFLQQPVFHGMAIEPSLRNGVVTLSGTVSSEAARELASDKVGEITGVRTVLNNLTVVEPGAKPAAAAVASPPAATPMSDQVKVLTLTPPATIPVRIREQLNTHTAKAGDTFHGVTATAVYQSGVVLIPAKTPVTGRVVSSKAARPFVGYAQLSLELTAIRLPVPQVGDKTLALVTLPLNSPAANSGSVFGNSVGVNGRTSNGPQAGTQIIVQPETVLEFSTAGPLLVAIQIQNGLPVPQNAASGDAVLAAAGDASASQPH
jgi:hypothetical protein